MQKPLSNNFFKYLTDWNITKMKYNGKGEMKWIIVYCLFLSKIVGIYLFILWSIDSKLIYHGIVLLWNLIFYMSGSEKGDIDRRKYCMYRWDRLLECEKLIDSNTSDRNKLVIEIIQRAEK